NLNWKPGGESNSLTAPLETLRGIVFSLPELPAARKEAVAQIAEQELPGDALLLDNGDRLVGELLEMDAEAATVDSAVGRTTVERRNVRSVIFDPALMSFPQVDGLRTLVSFVDGSRLTATDVDLEQSGTLRLRAAFGGELQVSLDEVSSMLVLGGRADYLSDL